MDSLAESSGASLLGILPRPSLSAVAPLLFSSPGSVRKVSRKHVPAGRNRRALRAALNPRLSTFPGRLASGGRFAILHEKRYIQAAAMRTTNSRARTNIPEFWET